MVIKQIFILLIVSILLGVGVNVISPNKIPFIGNYRDLSSGDGPIVPPSAQAGDPPFIASMGCHVAFELYSHACYEILRGDD